MDNNLNLLQQVSEPNPAETSTHTGGGPVVSVSGGLKTEDEHGEEEEDGDRNSTANRWPREETMALLNIRSEMDTAFRDNSPKAPLWEQVSRKLLEVGYHRSAKKCKEKFENIYKYHKRTKSGRFEKSNGKNYRFFEQLEALDNNPLSLPSHSSSSFDGQVVKTTTSCVVPNNVNVIKDAIPCSVRYPNGNVVDVDCNNSSSTNSSASKALSEGKKERLKHFLEGMMREVIENQERLQRELMAVMDKCEKERMAREAAWNIEELARIKRDRELLAHERAISAAKDEAVLALLKKLTENTTSSVLQFPDRIVVQDEKEKNNKQENGDNVSVNNRGGVVDKDRRQECGNVSVGSFMQMSSSRWPKDEVELQGQDNGSKGPLWEEISSAMKRIGCDRSAERCEEKQENINKYFKTIREKDKRKPEDLKTCPYYHQLEALYSSKKPKEGDESGGNSSNELRPEELLLHIMDSQEERSQQLESSFEDRDREHGRSESAGR